MEFSVVVSVPECSAGWFAGQALPRIFSPRVTRKINLWESPSLAIVFNGDPRVFSYGPERARILRNSERVSLPLGVKVEVRGFIWAGATEVWTFTGPAGWGTSITVSYRRSSNHCRIPFSATSPHTLSRSHLTTAGKTPRSGRTHHPSLTPNQIHRLNPAMTFRLSDPSTALTAHKVVGGGVAVYRWFPVVTPW